MEPLCVQLCVCVCALASECVRACVWKKKLRGKKQKEKMTGKWASLKLNDIFTRN